ncbi:TonB-dependent siderophore receptor [Pseudomonas sp. 13B_2.1_Bac1]|uniref:TonB-dependent siderophore receptor n=1 Tax=Pseudomonas sp. 13B_2.1_Bac1 TaxID=2971624 RepID=UPI0021C5A550|nr:TonB-dependent siderophore receptor [Pseudomonas sp. 13B_2.1_Bac1]MCU1785287.1 TonB-dependent siderophore receptor [Pseudomonas sp. 13B_2.1_Bac1]
MRHKFMRAIIGSVLTAASMMAHSEDAVTFAIQAGDVHAAVEQLHSMGYRVTLGSGVGGPARAVIGKMTLREALDVMLAGSDLEASWSRGEAFIRPRSVGTADGRKIGEVRVAGDVQSGQGGIAQRGVNGSSDETATEHSRAYSPAKVRIGGKTPTTLQHSVQSVSVISRQRIEDQQMNSLGDVMRWAPGVTTLQRGSDSQLMPHFFSRGFEIRNFQIDGGAPINYGSGNDYTSSLTPTFDMSHYDNVAVLRGADGINSGVGDPGGVLSLERKRPVAQAQYTAELSAGSWDARRTMFDVSQPLSEDGRWRVRAVATHDESDYFYRVADRQLDSGYVNLEFDPDEHTRINVGGSYTEQDAVPFSLGLPLYADGGDMALSRSTFIGMPFANQHTRNKEVFVQLEHFFAPDWSVNLNLSGINQDSNSLSSSVFLVDGVNRDTGTVDGQIMLDQRKLRSQQRVADAYVTGGFDLFGLRQKLVLGVSQQKQDDRNDAGGNYFYPQGPIDIVGFDPSAWARPDLSQFQRDAITVPAYWREQSAAYGSLQLELIEGLRVAASMRYNRYKTEQSTIYGGDFPSVQNTRMSENKRLPPTVSVSYDLTPQTTVYVSHAGIFNTNANKLTAAGTVLEPETGRTIEVGLRRSDFNGRLNSSLAFFDTVQEHIAQDDRESPSTDNPDTGISCCYFDSGKKTSKGFEAEIIGALTPSWQLAFSYTRNTIAFSSPQLAPSNFLTQAPKHTAKLFTSYRLGSAGWAGRTTLGGGLRYQSETVTNGFDGNGEKLVTRQGTYAVTDLFARVMLSRKVSLQANLANAFDRYYYASVGNVRGQNFYGEPRSVSLLLKMQF